MATTPGGSDISTTIIISEWETNKMECWFQLRCFPQLARGVFIVWIESILDHVHESNMHRDKAGCMRAHVLSQL